MNPCLDEICVSVIDYKLFLPQCAHKILQINKCNVYTFYKRGKILVEWRKNECVLLQIIITLYRPPIPARIPESDPIDHELISLHRLYTPTRGHTIIIIYRS